MSPTARRRGCATRSPRPPTASRRCAPARRPAWSTTSTTALAWGLVPLFLAAHGAERRRRSASSPRSTPASGASRRSAPATGPTRVGRKPLIVAGMLVQAAALALLAPQRRRASRSPPSAAVALGPRHRAGLPDADRRDLRRRLARRPRAGRRRLPLLARHGLRPRRPDRRRRRRRARLRRRHRPRRRTDRRLGAVGCPRHACSPRRRARAKAARRYRDRRDRRRGRASRAALIGRASSGPPHSRVSASRHARTRARRHCPLAPGRGRRRRQPRRARRGGRAVRHVRHGSSFGSCGPDHPTA